MNCKTSISTVIYMYKVLNYSSVGQASSNVAFMVHILFIGQPKSSKYGYAAGTCDRKCQRSTAPCTR